MTSRCGWHHRVSKNLNIVKSNGTSPAPKALWYISEHPYISPIPFARGPGLRGRFLKDDIVETFFAYYDSLHRQGRRLR